MENDLISRQAAIELMCRALHYHYEEGYAVSSMMALPSAQQERKKGKWAEEIGMLMCSECGDAWGTQQFDEIMSFNYCPNCGAKMEEYDE